eukprot:COSAG02_NODE_22539_length_749_cov_0.686154_1_plen_104_part_01
MANTDRQVGRPALAESSWSRRGLGSARRRKSSSKIPQAEAMDHGDVVTNRIPSRDRVTTESARRVLRPRTPRARRAARTAAPRTDRTRLCHRRSLLETLVHCTE